MYPCDIKKSRNEYMQQWYVRNRESILERNRKYRLNNLDKVKSTIKRLKVERLAKIAVIKHIQGCKECDESDARCLDFHHRDPKDKILCVSQMCLHSWNKVLSEIEKCDVLCSNCHRKLTHS